MAASTASGMAAPPASGSAALPTGGATASTVTGDAASPEGETAAPTSNAFVHLDHATATRRDTDEELSRTLDRVLKIALVIVFLSALAAPFSMARFAPTIGVHALFFLCLSTSYLYLRSGRRHAAGAVLSGGFWLVSTAAVFAFGGVHSPGVFVYLPTVAAAGLFWSRRSATILAIASAGIVLFAAQLEALGALPKPLAPIPPERLWTVFCGSLLMTAFLFISAVRRLSTLARDLAQSRSLLEDLATAQEQAESARSELEQRLEGVERLESVARLAGGAAHDFNNLLSIILNSAAVLKREVPGGSFSADLISEIDEATNRAIELVRKLLASPGRNHRSPKLVDVNAVVAGLSSILKRLARSDVEVVIELRAVRATVYADPGELEQVILNLALNARDAMPRGGRLVVETRDSVLGVEDSDKHDGFVALSVSDEGVGMDAATASRIFEPFFTTKGSAGGTGLGLASVQRIVNQSGGRIELQTAPGRGTRFEVLLPRSDRAPQA